MIIVSSQRGGAKALGCHLMNTSDNEHVAVHEMRGFVSDDIVGAFKEAQAISKGTKCKQFLFSCSFNPPETEQVSTAHFEEAINRLEEKTGLSGQPRVVVFHEKEGRRHAHAVWSRIDPETMTAKQLSFSKQKCMELSKELYLEHGWKMPKGMMQEPRDPRNFTLAEWQQSKRAGFHARDLKQIVGECWSVSDSRGAFASALEEHGLKLARGDRRGHVVVSHEGEVFSVARYTGKKTKEVKERLGDPAELKSVDETKDQFVRELTPKFEAYLKQQEAKSIRAEGKLTEEKLALRDAHRNERTHLQQQQDLRWQEEVKDRAARLNKGLQGLWDRVTGDRKRTEERNLKEAQEALRRDKKQRNLLIQAQLGERQKLQEQIKDQRSKSLKEKLAIHKQLDDLRKGRLEPEKPKPKLRERTEQQRQSIRSKAQQQQQAPPQISRPIQPERKPASAKVAQVAKTNVPPSMAKQIEQRLAALRERNANAATTRPKAVQQSNTADRLKAQRGQSSQPRRDGPSQER